MADDEVELSDEEKKEIAKWFLLNAPAGEIQFVAKGNKLQFGSCRCLFLDIHFRQSFPVIFLVRIMNLMFRGYQFSDVKKILNDDKLYHEAASEAFPQYNKSHMISLEMPGLVGDVSFLYRYSL